MTASEKRQAVIKMYETILGRNHYSRSLRDYCFKRYSDGKYYSDCSSSVSYCYKQAGYSFGILNTVGMYNSKKLKTVDVNIVKGQIQDVSKLRPGDMLLFAGKDSSRASSGYVGHVEMVYSVGTSTNDTILVGHGSNYPAKHNCKTYCANRQSTKTSTKKGNKGLIKVVRFIQDDPNEEFFGSEVVVTGKTVYIRVDAVKTATYVGIAKNGDQFPFTGIVKNGWNQIYYNGSIAYISNRYSKLVIQPEPSKIVVTGNSVNIRSDANKNSKTLGIAKKGQEFEYTGITDNGWYKIYYNGIVAYISNKYSKAVV